MTRKMGRIVFALLLCLTLNTYYLIHATDVKAYTTNMSASVVVGQADFTSAVDGSVSPSASGLSYPTGIAIDGQKLVVSDQSNSRVLIFNSIPTSNNQSADAVVGQQNMVGNSANQGGSVGANTLKYQGPILMVDSKLLVSDNSNRRVLIFNSIPTANNVSADVVIGQISMSASTNSTSQTTMRSPWKLAYDSSSGKLAVLDGGYANRILIYNQIPTSNGASADVVVGQTDFTTETGGTTANKLSYPNSALFANGKLLVADNSNNRVLIWNSIPTTNGASADVVIGQQNMTSGSANQGGSVGANTLYCPTDLAWDGKRLFVTDGCNARILVFNGIPTSNNASAYMVIGQPNFTTNTTHNGAVNGEAANTLSDFLDVGLVINNNRLFVSDSDNNRVLIYNNLEYNPGLSLSNSINTSPDNKYLTRITGNATTSSPYTLSNVSVSVNGGSGRYPLN